MSRKSAAETIEPVDRDMPLTMPAPAEVAASDIDRIGVEGLPGDPKAGPGLLRLELVAVGLVLVGAAVGTGLWLGWPVGLAMLGWLALAIAINPVLGATMQRIQDRKRATHEERIEVRPFPDDRPVPHA